MIFFIFGILALLAAFCLFRSEYKAAAVIPGALAAVLIVISCVSFVPTGYTGIVTTFGKVENGTKDAGVVVKAPWQSIVKMDNRVQEVSIDLSAFSSDIQEVATSVTVGYRINQANAMTIFLGSLVLVIFSLYIAVESIGRDNIQPGIKPCGYGKLDTSLSSRERFTSVNSVFQHISKNTAQIYVGYGKLVWKINIQIDINSSFLCGGN